MDLLTAHGELLGSVDFNKDTSVEEAAFLVQDAALATARLKRNDEVGARTLRRLALYNPYTAQVALGSVPRTEVYTDNKALALPADGAVASSEDGLLWVGERVLALQEPQYRNALRALEMHSDAH